MSREIERAVEVAAMLAQRIGGAVGDVIPAEAHGHLLNAQRELLTALFLIYEHQVGARRPEPPEPAPSRRRSGGARPAATRRPRVQHIEIE